MIREELSLRRELLKARRVEASGRKVEAMKMLMKMKARLAFIAAGGTRAGFDRMWPELIKEESDYLTA